MAAQQQRLRRTYRERRYIFFFLFLISLFFAECNDAGLLEIFRLDRAGIIAVTD